MTNNDHETLSEIYGFLDSLDEWLDHFRAPEKYTQPIFSLEQLVEQLKAIAANHAANRKEGKSDDAGSIFETQQMESGQ